MPYEFKGPNGITYTLTERWVQIGFGRWSSKPVYDLTSPYGTRTYGEKELARAFADRFNITLEKGERAVRRYKSGALTNRYA